MASDASSFALSLRPPPRKRDAEPLSQLIGRINEERGHFRNITEDSLRAEIEVKEARGAQEDTEEEETVVVEDKEARRKEIYTARGELLQLIGQAQNEALTALDFISLLLSKETPTAETSMSPLLKQLVPSGTLAFQKTQLPTSTKAQENHNQLVCAGWSYKSVETAADSLLRSATRLEEEMGKEARYWEQVLSISEQKWPVCRMPKERHTIGVRFGFSEASPMYHARGLAALRPNATGDIILDQGLSRQPKILRIRMEENDRITSISGSTLDLGSSEGIEALIRRARDSLFEEELFHELLREVRAGLLSYGMAVEDHIIRVPVASFATDTKHNSQRCILIDLVDRDEYQDVQSQPRELNKNPSSTTLPASPNSIALALRILLTQTYRQRFRKRSEPPPPMSEEKRSPPVHSLLRPVIAYIQHADAVRGLSEFMSNVLKVLESAGVPSCYAGEITSNSTFPEKNNHLNHNTQSIVETLLSTVDAPLKAQVTLSIISFSSEREHMIVVDTSTHFSPPTYGTLFHITPLQFQTPTTSTAPAPEPFPHKTLHSVTEYITYLVCRAVASSITTLSKLESLAIEPTDQSIQGWVLEDSGTDLRRVWMNEEKVRRLSVVWQNGGLMLVCAENGVRAKMVGCWNGGTGGTAQLKQTDMTLPKVVESCGMLLV